MSCLSRARRITLGMISILNVGTNLITVDCVVYEPLIPVGERFLWLRKKFFRAGTLFDALDLVDECCNGEFFGWSTYLSV